MARTYSEMMPLGTVAPDFNLEDTLTGKFMGKSQTIGECGLVVMFICNHCPFVIHVLDEIIKVANEYQAKGVGFVAISSNDATNYPADSPEKMTELGKSHQFTFPYLYDESQQIAKKYQAACTPDFYLFNNEQKCVYRGRLDESSPGNGKPVTGKDLREALDKLISLKPQNELQMPSVGCNIKWKN
jgi:thiol-disulfide isomerase/thioredoxin